MSQEGLAEKLGVDRTTVARWERGETDPQPWWRPKLCGVLQVSTDELAALLGQPSPAAAEAPDVLDCRSASEVSAYALSALHEAEVMIVERRQLLLQGIAAVAATCGLLGGGHSPASRHLGASDVARLSAITALYRSVDYEVGGGVVYPEVARFAEAASRLLDQSYPSKLAPSLLTAVAAARQLAGWTAFDSWLHADACRHFLCAERTAVAAGDLLLAARVRYCQARQLQHLRHNGDALDSLRLAREQLAERATPAVSAMLYGAEAASLAALGEKDAALGSLSRAIDQFERIDVDLEPDWMRFYDRGELLAQYGRVYRDLARDDRSYGNAAVKWVVEANAAYSPQNVRSAVLGEVGHTSALFLADEPEQAMASGHRVINLAKQLTSPRILDRIRNVQRDLVRHQELPDVATFARTLSTIAPASPS